MYTCGECGCNFTTYTGSRLYCQECISSFLEEEERSLNNILKNEGEIEKPVSPVSAEEEKPASIEVPRCSIPQEKFKKGPYYRSDNLKYSARRDRRLRQNGGKHSKEEWLILLESYGYKCAICGSEEEITKDHIVPVSKGGGDSISNIQPLCWSCNKKKGNKLP